jgi:hypothetical protein
MKIYKKNSLNIGGNTVCYIIVENFIYRPPPINNNFGKFAWKMFFDKSGIMGKKFSFLYAYAQMHHVS